MIFLVFSNDAFAYLIGKMIGKTPLTKLSPKKSLEGFYGGFLGTCFVALTFYMLLDTYKTPRFFCKATKIIDFPFSTKNCIIT